MGFAMLLALLLPLQGYGALPTCGEPVPMAISAATPAVRHHCDRATTATHQHICTHGCCSAAMALTAALIIPPRSGAALMSSAAIALAPEGALERLDRPPRFIPA